MSDSDTYSMYGYSSVRTRKNYCFDLSLTYYYYILLNGIFETNKTIFYVIDGNMFVFY